MKRHISVLLFFAFLLTMFASSVFMSSAANIGDIDNNGRIESMDYLYLRRAYFSQYNLPDKSIGDIDGNGNIDSMDYLFLKRAYFNQYNIKNEPETESGFEIRFIDVGQADAALVLCDGEAMLIDGGNAGDSSLIYSVLKNNNITHLNYVIGTHAHEDHIGGLAGALNFATVDTVYCPTDSYDSEAFNNFKKAVEKQDASITIPKVDETFEVGSAKCIILAVNTNANDPNNSSIVLRITYDDTSFLFAADAERDVEQAILDRGADIGSTLLKVGHHGSETSTSYVWLREIMPEYAIVSVGEDNTYGHPTEEVLSRLRDAEVKTFRTDMQGDILCVSDGKTITITPTRNANADVFGNIGDNSTQNPESSMPESSEVESSKPESSAPEVSEPEASDPEDNESVVYITPTGKRYHLDPDCGGANSRESTLEVALGKGLTPCKKCAQ